MNPTASGILILSLFYFLNSCSESKPGSTDSGSPGSQVAYKVVNQIKCDLLSDWKRAKTFTREYLEAMPAEYYDFRPTPDILPFSHEFLHLGCVNYRYAAMMAGSTDCSSDQEMYEDPELQSKEAVIAFVMNSYDVMIDRIQAEENLEAGTHYYGWSCSKACLSRKGFEHQSHHRGKTAIYLRLKGISPPLHRLINDWTLPKDISEEAWTSTEAYKAYEKIIDTKK